MPLTGDTRALQALQKNLRALGTPGSPAERRFLATVRKPLKPAVQAMYTSGTGPDGAWTPRADGKPALVSAKLPGMVAIARIPGGFLIAWRRAWMAAHDEGHTFAARAVAAGRSLFFSKNGRLVAQSRFERRERTAATSMQAIQALLATGVTGSTRAKLEGRLRRLATGVGFVAEQRAHHIGARVLPARHQRPRGGLPALWVDAIARGADEGFREFTENATG